MDTIFAEATPPGRGGVSVVRLSGPDARAIGEDLVGPLPEPRRAELRSVRDGELIDRGLVLRFDSGASFTGEDVVEFHLHGAPVVVARLEQALRARGARRAEAGEFTRRAFLTGAVSLADAEGLADLLSAETEGQRRQAMRVAAGELTRWAESLRAPLIRAGALIEASLDFADEDVPESVPDEVFGIVSELRMQIDDMLSGFPAAERVRKGFEVAFVGPPNAGKSSLLNCIAGREVALVSEYAGTTRDVLSVDTDLRGLAVTFLDTAGLRDAGEQIERMGIARGRERAMRSDLRIHLGTPVDAGLWQPGDLAVQSKADLGGGDVSAVTGEGVSGLLDAVYAVLSQRVAGAGLIAHRRQAEALRDAADSLLSVTSDVPAELIAERLRVASHCITALVGRIDAEDYLDEVFSSFCIGK